MKLQVFALPLMTVLLASTVAADEREDGAVAEIENLGGKIRRDDKLPGRPVVFIDLRGANITDAALQALASFEMLRQLHVGGAHLTDKALKYLTPLRHLQKLGLSNTEVTDAGLKELEGLKELQKFWLYGSRVSDAGVQQLKAKLPKCDVQARDFRPRDDPDGSSAAARPKTALWWSLLLVAVIITVAALLLWRRKRTIPSAESASGFQGLESRRDGRE